jgi:hypothetical protein
VQYIVAEQPDPVQGDSRKNRKHLAGSVPVSDTDSILPFWILIRMQDSNPYPVPKPKTK